MNYSNYSTRQSSQPQNSNKNFLFPSELPQKQEIFNQKIKFSPLFFDLNRRVYKVLFNTQKIKIIFFFFERTLAKTYLQQIPSPK